MELSITFDTKEVERALGGLKNQVPFATALALTRTAQFVKRKIEEEMPRVFDRPTRFTLGSLYIKPATKRDLHAQVKVKDEVANAVNAPIKWLAPQIYGGARGHKRFEQLLIQHNVMPAGMYAVPSAAVPLDGYGNVSRGILNRVLSDLRAHFDVLNNTSAVSKQRRLKRRKQRATFFFSTYPPSKKTAHLRPGIYQRFHFGFGTSIKPFLIFVHAPRYRRRLRFFEIAEQSARMRLPFEFQLALRRAIDTAGLRAA